jgi:hypothetical protein
MRKPALLAGLALAASVLTGCGGGDDAEAGATDTETYCKQLETDAEFFNALGGGDADPSKLGDALDRFHELADAAPEAVAPDWDRLDGALSELERSLAEAGITPDDLAGLESGELPKGVDMTKLTKLVPKVQKLNSPELKDAAESIRTHAKDECGVTLGE